MTSCPACKGTGRLPREGPPIVLVSAWFMPPAPCKSCGGSGKLVDVLLAPPALPHGVGCPCEECQTF